MLLTGRTGEKRLLERSRLCLTRHVFGQINDLDDVKGTVRQ